MEDHKFEARKRRGGKRKKNKEEEAMLAYATTRLKLEDILLSENSNH